VFELADERIPPLRRRPFGIKRMSSDRLPVDSENRYPGASSGFNVACQGEAVASFNLPEPPCILGGRGGNLHDFAYLTRTIGTCPEFEQAQRRSREARGVRKNGYVPHSTEVEGYPGYPNGGRQSVAITLNLSTSSVDLTGNYDITFTADTSCRALPDAARVRTYSVTISLSSGAPTPNQYQGVLTGARFLTPPDGDRFCVGVAGSRALRRPRLLGHRKQDRGRTGRLDVLRVRWVRGSVRWRSDDFGALFRLVRVLRHSDSTRRESLSVSCRTHLLQPC
jgi:hypothetical protein